MIPPKNKDEIEFMKDISRIGRSLKDIRIWSRGENPELKKLIGFGFENHLFVVKDGKVTLYYDKEESDKFYEILDEVLDDDFFNEICDCFMELVEQSENAPDEEIPDIFSKLWAYLAILYEVSYYPEYVSEYSLRRLERIRKCTESLPYKLRDRLKYETSPEVYHFFRGEVIEGMPEFLK